MCIRDRECPPGDAQTCLPLCTAHDLGSSSTVLHAILRTCRRRSPATGSQGIPSHSCRPERQWPTHECLNVLHRAILEERYPANRRSTHELPSEHLVHQRLSF